MIARPLSMFVIAATFFLGATHANAAVEYVRVCSIYGAGFFYVPGTDTCFNPVTGETRVQTEGGTWTSLAPNAPQQWVPNAAAGCIGGSLVELNTLHGTDFALNGFTKLEAALAGITLGQGDFIASFLMSGGLTQQGAAHGTVRFSGTDGTVIPAGTEIDRADGTKYLTDYDVTIGNDGTAGQIDVTAAAKIAGVGGVMDTGTTLSPTPSISGVTSVVSVAGFDSTTIVSAAHSNLCIAFRDSAARYIPVGCEDVTALKDQVATLAFSPRRATLPAELTAPIGLVATAQSNINGIYDGELKVSACVRNTSADGAACTVVPNSSANGVTLNCGSSNATISNGSSCSVADKGDGTATITCPDGSAVALSTKAGSKDDGCNSVPASSGLFIAVAAAMHLLRRREPRSKQAANPGITR